MDGVLRLVDVRDVVLDAALVVELDRLAALGALVGERDAPLVRNATSRKRDSSVVASYTVSSKISASARNVVVVPVSLDSPAVVIGPRGTPRSNSCRYTLPSRSTWTTSHSESALTTDAPTPCSPPETL
jgi:hypothetical protein